MIYITRGGIWYLLCGAQTHWISFFSNLRKNIFLNIVKITVLTFESSCSFNAIHYVDLFCSLLLKLVSQSIPVLVVILVVKHY